MKYHSLLAFGFLVLPAYGSETPISDSERSDLYRKHSMEYADQLLLKFDGSPEDEIRSRKAEALNQSIRARTIAKLERHLSSAKEKRVRRELFHRLAQLNEQQAEVISRRSDLNNKEELLKQALRESNRNLLSLRREFPDFAPDATLFNLAENFGKLKEDKTAENYYREVVQRFPKSPVVADSLLAIGNLYFDRKAFLTARSFFERILTTPEVNLHPYGHYKIAWSYFNESEYSKAIAGLEKAILESRKIQANGTKKLGVEDEALTDLVLFFAESGEVDTAKVFFERLVGKEKAQELRYNLAKRLFDHGKHALARNTAQELLAENPRKEHIHKIYLILIAVAERTKDRELGLRTAEKLSSWLKDEKGASEEASRIESEEYLRLYSQKLHHEAETLKQKEIWAQARKSYEIYLATFPNEAESAEVKFRFAVLLMNRKEQLKAYQTVTDALPKMDSKHPRFKEALKLRIQSIELSNASERKQIPDSEALLAYDEYARAFPEEELGLEAMFKAANLAKNLETPEQTASRFRTIAEKHPDHKLAKSAVAEALAVLVKAERWEALGAESKALSSPAKPGALAADQEVTKKISEARELSWLKITEGLEKEGKFEEAAKRYESILGEQPTESLSIFAHVRLAQVYERNLQRKTKALEFLDRLRTVHPATKEARQALLEQARLNESLFLPREAVQKLQEFSRTGSGSVEQQAATNAAIMLENLGDRKAAAAAFFDLLAKLRAEKAKASDIKVALESACNNTLLRAHQEQSKEVFQAILKCGGEEPLTGQPVWQARAAWALDQLAQGMEAEAKWRRLASLRSGSEAERPYLYQGKLTLLRAQFTEFQKLKFTRTNERPEANIRNKTEGLAQFEKMAESILKNGTPKQVEQARELIYKAYIDFAETMEQAAVPSTLAEGEAAELKKTFATFGQNFREKAVAWAPAEKDVANRAPAAIEQEHPRLPEAKLSREEENWLKSGEIPEERKPVILAKKSLLLFSEGKYGEARFFAERWKKALEGTPDGNFGSTLWEQFDKALRTKLPDNDPMAALL
jgi:cellulose synthase operon protein C